MKNIKRLLALGLVLVMALSFTACHKKGEIAVKIGDVEFTSAYYMCVLMASDSEAKNLVYEELSDEEKNSGEEIDYYSKKVEGKKYVEWVEEKTIETLKEIAAYKILCKENKLELEEKQIQNSETYADYYWTSYGYSAYYEPNGVSEATYKEYMKDTYYAERYFTSIYGKDGKTPIAEDEVTTKIYDNFIIANLIQQSITSEMSEEDVAALKTQFDAYKSDIESGEKTFEQIYMEHNQISEEDHKHEEVTDNSQPKDPHATILSSDGTAYANDNYATVKAMATGEVKVLTAADASSLTLAVKQEIKDDPYYLTALDSVARHLMKDEEFEKDIADYCKDLKVEINDYAVKQFKVKKIKEPEM